MPKPLTGLSDRTGRKRKNTKKDKNKVDLGKKINSENLSHLFYLSFEIGKSYLIQWIE